MDVTDIVTMVHTKRPESFSETWYAKQYNKNITDNNNDNNNNNNNNKYSSNDNEKYSNNNNDQDNTDTFNHNTTTTNTATATTTTTKPLEHDLIRINVTGVPYVTFRDTVEQFPATLLGSEHRRIRYYVRSLDAYFFDRNRECFEAILYYYQSGGNVLKLCPMDSYTYSIGVHVCPNALQRFFLILYPCQLS